MSLDWPGKGLEGEIAVSECIATELAELIEAGLAMDLPEAAGKLRIVETTHVFLHLRGSTCQAGALGLAFLGRARDPGAALDQWLQVESNSKCSKLEAAAHLLGVPVALAKLVEINHRNGLSAVEIARCLRLGVLGIVFGAAPLASTGGRGGDSVAAELAESFPLETVRT